MTSIAQSVPGSAGKIRLPELGRWEALGLWLSLQRYALLLALGALALPVGLWLAEVRALGAWLIAGFVVLVVAAPALTISRRFPAKIHALRVALYRIDRGVFTPDRVRHHCGDPCFRLVAAAALRRAGWTWRARRRLIRGYAAALREERSALVIIDHQRGEVRAIVGGRETRTALQPDLR